MNISVVMAAVGSQELANTLTITTSDSVLTYSVNYNNSAFDVKDNLANNNKTTSTQGFLIKKQIGSQRIEGSINIIDSRTNINASLIPFNLYPVPVDITIDRNWVGKSTATARFEIVGMNKFKDLDGNDEEWKIMIVEVIGV